MASWKNPTIAQTEKSGLLTCVDGRPVVLLPQREALDHGAETGDLTSAMRKTSAFGGMQMPQKSMSELSLSDATGVTAHDGEIDKIARQPLRKMDRIRGPRVSKATSSHRFTPGTHIGASAAAPPVVSCRWARHPD